MRFVLLQWLLPRLALLLALLVGQILRSTKISTLGPLVVMVIGIAHGIHIVSVYAQGLHSHLSKLDAMRHSLAVNIQPVTLATITTSMGFLSLNYSSSPGIYGFGNIVALGTVGPIW